VGGGTQWHLPAPVAGADAPAGPNSRWGSEGSRWEREALPSVGQHGLGAPRGRVHCLPELGRRLVRGEAEEVGRRLGALEEAESGGVQRTLWGSLVWNRGGERKTAQGHQESRPGVRLLGTEGEEGREGWYLHLPPYSSPSPAAPLQPSHTHSPRPSRLHLEEQRFPTPGRETHARPVTQGRREAAAGHHGWADDDAEPSVPLPSSARTPAHPPVSETHGVGVPGPPLALCPLAPLTSPCGSGNLSKFGPELVPGWLPRPARGRRLRCHRAPRLAPWLLLSLCTHFPPHQADGSTRPTSTPPPPACRRARWDS
jgi:hypothetical protein